MVDIFWIWPYYVAHHVQGHMLCAIRLRLRKVGQKVRIDSWIRDIFSLVLVLVLLISSGSPEVADA